MIDFYSGQLKNASAGLKALKREAEREIIKKKIIARAIELMLDYPTDAELNVHADDMPRLYHNEDEQYSVECEAIEELSNKSGGLSFDVDYDDEDNDWTLTVRRDRMENKGGA